MGTLLGLGAGSLRNRDAMPDRAKLHFAGLPSNQTRHAEGLGAILSTFFAVPVEVACFIGAWLTLPPADRTRLGGGRAAAALGDSALVGGRAWTRQQKFRVIIGPLTLDETALALAESLYGGEQNLVTINMSEFQEAHTVSTLKGAPPGYVGYGEGGVLTEAVRRKPYSVVLLDEVEKAHPDMHEMSFQVFDKGFMEDGEGRFMDFKNTLIPLTSNVGTDLIMSLCADPELIPEADEMAKALRGPLLKVFPPALLGRLIAIPYCPLSDAVMADIIRLQLGRIARRAAERHGVAFTWDDAVVALIASRCTEPESGGRMIDAILTNTMLPAISEAFLTRMLEGRTVSRVAMRAEAGGFGYRFE